MRLVKGFLLIIVLLTIVSSCKDKELYKIVRYHNNGSTSVIEWFKNSYSEKNLFKTLEYSKKGKLIQEELINGNDIKTTKYYTNEQQKSAYEYKDGLRYGKWQFWHENSVLENEITYVNGMLQGDDILFDKDKEIIGKGTFNNGTGQFKSWFKNKSKKSELVLKNGKGKMIEYFESGVKKKETEYLNCMQNGKGREWYKSGNLKIKVSLKNDKLHGEKYEWHEDGGKKLKANFKNGKSHGKYFEWNKEGRLIGEGNFDKGNGTWKAWDDKGKLKMDGSFKGAAFTGIMQRYNEKGVKIGEIYLKEDQYDGVSKEWDDNGKLIRKMTFKEGKTLDIYTPPISGTKLEFKLKDIKEEKLIKKGYLKLEVVRFVQNSSSNSFGTCGKNLGEQFIKISENFYIGRNVYGFKEKTKCSGFGIYLKRSDVNTFSWEWYNHKGLNIYEKLQGEGYVEVNYKKFGECWYIASMKFYKTNTLRAHRSGTWSSETEWTCEIADGSYIDWTIHEE